MPPLVVPSSRRLSSRLLAGALGALVVLLGAAPAVAGPAAVPCTASGSHHTCQWRVPGNGTTGGAPVLAANGARVGYLHEGKNWVLCQKTGRRDHDGAFFNDVWGYTTADNGKKGWVNALWAHGGGNDGGFSGTPPCTASYGSPPGGTASPTPPTTPAPTPTNPAPPTTPVPPAAGTPVQVPCASIGKGRHSCDWRVGGNGRSGGTPVLASNGARVGYLHQGKNWVLCQRTGREESYGGAKNDVWGYTTADNGKKGWANALWAHGGGDDGGFSGTPTCAPKYGTPPSSGTTKAPPTPKTPAPAADSCAHTNETGTATLTYRLYETRRHYVTPGNVAQAPMSQDDQKPAHHTFGTIAITADTCKSPSGWRVMRSVGVTQHAVGLYKDASDHAAIRGSGSSRGWGVGISSTGDGTLDVQYTACHKTGTGWPIVKEIVGIPLKGLPYKGSLLKYTVGKLIPSPETKCDDVGTSRITLSVDGHGKLVVHSQDLTFGQTQEKVIDNPQDPGNYHLHTKAPDPPQIRVVGH